MTDELEAPEEEFHGPVVRYTGRANFRVLRRSDFTGDKEAEHAADEIVWEGNGFALPWDSVKGFAESEENALALLRKNSDEFVLEGADVTLEDDAVEFAIGGTVAD